MLPSTSPCAVGRFSPFLHFFKFSYPLTPDRSGLVFAPGDVSPRIPFLTKRLSLFRSSFTSWVIGVSYDSLSNLAKGWNPSGLPRSAVRACWLSRLLETGKLCMAAKEVTPSSLPASYRGEYSRCPCWPFRSFNAGSDVFGLSATSRLPGFGYQENPWLTLWIPHCYQCFATLRSALYSGSLVHPAAWMVTSECDNSLGDFVSHGVSVTFVRIFLVAYCTHNFCSSFVCFSRFIVVFIDY